MKIVNCLDVEDQLIYDAFNLGFSDYMIKFDMELPLFFERFFGAEGNDKAYSFVAFDGDTPVGIVLGGINEYDGIKTLRCGALSVAPDYRGQGVSQQLMLAHESIATAENCSQLMLEVIGGNNRAIHFYENLGYTRTYNLYFYSLSKINFNQIREKKAVNPSNIHTHFYSYSNPTIVTSEDLVEIKKAMADIHINWQNDFHFIDKLDKILIYGIYLSPDHIPHNLVSFVILNELGKIFRIYTLPNHRGNALGKALLDHIFTVHPFEKLTCSSPGNSAVSTFLFTQGFAKEEIFQYEMSKIIK